MSHFTVMVMSYGPGEVDELLAPYDENIEVEPYIRYTKEDLIRNKRNNLKDYEKRVYAEYLADPDAYRVKVGPNSEAHLDYVSKEFPLLLSHIDDDEFLYKKALESYEEDDIDKETGGIISTYNPKSKWDWWVEGGRWSNYLTLKDGSKADDAYAEEIDFSPSKEDISYYSRLWDIIVNGEKPENRDEEFSARFYRKESLLAEYGTKENYIEKQTAFHTYAVITPDGEWYEPGEMGWWGVSFATDEDNKKWNEEFPKFIEEAIENNYYITIVDCHI